MNQLSESAQNLRKLAMKNTLTLPQKPKQLEIKWSTNYQWVGKPDKIDHTDEYRKAHPKISAKYDHHYEYNGTWVSLGKRWENIETTLSDWWNAVTVDGIAVGPYIEEEDNEEKSKSMSTFRSHQVALVDIDHGLTIESLLDNQFYKDYASGYYTSPSHTDEEHRFRIVFVLENPVTHPEYMRHLYIGLIAFFGGDAACKDSSRLFFGCVNAERKSFDSTKRLPQDMMDTLVQWSKDQENKYLERQEQVDYEPPTDKEKRELIEKLKTCYVGAYDDWIRVGFAMKNSGFSVEDFIEVSLAATNSKTPARCKELWRNNRTSGRRSGFGTLVHFAKTK